MSLYYGRSPYLENRNGRSMFSSGRSRLFSKKARRTFMRGAVKGSQAVKAGAETLKGIAAAARDVGKKKMKFEFGPGTVMAGLGVIGVGLSLAYLAYFNQVATRGYEMTRLEADRQQLLNQYEIKNMKLAEIQSLSNIASSERVSAMRRPSGVEFVRGNTAIALK